MGMRGGRKAGAAGKTNLQFLAGRVRADFKAVLENKPFIMNVYRSVSKEQIESYLYKLTFELIEGVVNEKAEGTGLPEEDKRFIADFYKYGFVGVMLDWIKDGMQEDYSTIVKKMSLTLHGNISNSIGNFLDEV